MPSRLDQRHRLGAAWVRLLDGVAPRVASTVRARWAVIRNPHATVSFGRGVYLGPGFSLHAPRGGTFTAGDDADFRRGFRCELAGPGATVTVGSAAQASYGVLMQCTTTIHVGDRVLLSEGTSIFDGNHRFRDVTMPVFAQGYDFRSVRIGDDALIHAKCTIVASVGERTVVGANSLVNKELPGYVIAGGVPARVIGELSPQPTETPAP